MISLNEKCVIVYVLVESWSQEMSCYFKALQTSECSETPCLPWVAQLWLVLSVHSAVSCLDLLLCLFIFQVVEAAGLQGRGASCLPRLMSSASTQLHSAKTVCLSVREKQPVSMCVFVRSKGSIVFLCTKDQIMLGADNTLQASMGCKRKSQCSKICMIVNSLVSVWTIELVTTELKHCKGE